MATTAKTPGYDHRLEIWFSTTKRGQKVAHFFSSRAFRAFRLPLADAELFIALGQADQVAGHPFRP